MRAKPAACHSCILERRGFGYAPPGGPTNSQILFLAEALGGQEAAQGENLAGRAGTIFNRLVYRNHLQRDNLRIANCVMCRPPDNKLSGMPYEFAALNHCREAYLNPVLDEPRPVVVAMGKVPLCSLLNLPRHKVKVQDFHGRVLRDPQNRFWVVPTFHPSHLARGAMNLFGAVSWAFQRAEEIMREGWEPEEEPELLMDPPVAQFDAWVDEFEQALAEDPGLWLAVDVETPDKQRKQDEGELSATKDQSFQILRHNFAWKTTEGLTVPNTGPYQPGIRRLMRSQAAKVYWHRNYDLPRYRFHRYEIGGHQLDGMWMWHALQSDLPRGLGFVSAYYSRLPPWKHLSALDPVRYAAKDPVHTLLNALGVARDLQRQGMWDVYWRHMQLVDQFALGPSAEVGTLVDQEALKVYGDELLGFEEESEAALQPLIPQALLPLRPKDGWTRKPEESSPGKVWWKQEDGTLLEAPLVEVQAERDAQVCEACGAQQIAKSHRCKDWKTLGLTPKVVVAKIQTSRWFRREPFNPRSSPQVLAYIVHRGHKPGKNKQDKTKASADKETLKRLRDQTKDPFYAAMLDNRQVGRVRRNYVEGTWRRLQTDYRSLEDGRLHPTPTHNPSTLRTSYTAPNLQNVVSRDSGERNLAAGFRRCIIAERGERVGCTCLQCQVAPSLGALLMELDFSAIEAVITGWLCGDPNFIRLAKLGIHGFVASQLLFQQGKIPEPGNLAWSDEKLGAFLRKIKEEWPYEYDQCKRVVHGTNYGLTVDGMVKQFPKEFPTRAVAAKVRAVYEQVAPKLFAWQNTMRRLADKQGYLGGQDHPFAYRHWFWDIYTYDRISRAQYDRAVAQGKHAVQMDGRYYMVYLGEDGKRCVAFYPQSIAAGVIKEAMLRLFDPESPSYIGEAFHGVTPLRALVHDSLLLEVPVELRAWVLERAVQEMQRPIPQLPCPEEWGMGPYLQIGVEAKEGTNWAPYEDREGKVANLGGMKKIKELPGVAYDMPSPEVLGDEDPDDEEDDDGRAGVEEAAGLGA